MIRDIINHVRRALVGFAAAATVEPAPAVEPAGEPVGPLAHLASLVPGQDISAVLATLPDAPKGRRGRPYAYPQDRAASPAERQRRRYWQAKGKARREPHENRREPHENDFREPHENPLLKEAASPAERQRRRYWQAKGKARREPHENRREPHENDFREPHENPLLKEEEKKERSGSPISKDWRPDPDGERLGKEVFGDQYEAQLADHIDYCLKTDFRCHDHDANWRRRCRALQRNPQLRLDLRPRGPQVHVVDIEPKKKRNGLRGRREVTATKTVQDVARELAEEYREQMRDAAPPT